MGQEATKEFLPMQAGDVYTTYADISRINSDYGFEPTISLEEGIGMFVKWFKKAEAVRY